jgi:hypothetical protein
MDRINITGTKVLSVVVGIVCSHRLMMLLAQHVARKLSPPGGWGGVLSAGLVGLRWCCACVPACSAGTKWGRLLCWQGVVDMFQLDGVFRCVVDGVITFPKGGLVTYHMTRLVTFSVGCATTKLIFA